MTTTTDNYRVTVDTSQADRSLANLNNRINATTNLFGKFKTALLAVGFATFARSAISAAGEIKDLGESTGFAVGELARLKVLLNSFGGASDKLPQLITTYSKKVDEAREGSLKAQNTFRELGISLSDLSKLSTEELFKKTLSGLGNLETGAHKTALQLELFGKSAATLDPGGLGEAFAKGTKESDSYARSVIRAGELNDNLAKATDNIKLAFLEAFEPAINLVNQLSNATEEGNTQLQKMVIVLKLVGAVMVSTFAIGIIRPMVTMLGTLGRGFGLIAGSAGAAGLARSMASVFRVTGPLLGGLRAIGIVISGGLGIYAASQLFDNLGDIAVNSVSRIIESIGELAASILNLPTDAIAGLLNLFGAGITKAYGLGDGVQYLVDKAKEARLESEKSALAIKKAKEESESAKESLEKPANVPVTVDTTELDKAILAAKRIGDQYIETNSKIKEQITLDTILIDKSKEQADAIRAKAALYDREEDQIQRLIEAQQNLSKEQKDAGVAAEYDRQIERVKQLTIEEEKTLDMLIQRQQTEQRIADIKQFTLQQEIAGQDKLRQIQSDTAQLTMTALARRYKEIEDSAENTFQARLAEAKLNKETLSDSDISQIRDAAYAGVNAQKEAAKTYHETSRSFSTGWEQAFNDYVDNATNAANQARDVFQKVTQGMEDMIINFAKTGKFEFVSFINSIVEMLLRSEIQRTMASIFSATRSPGGAGVTGVFSGLGSLLGFANGGLIPHNGPVIVGERGPEILSGAGGRSVTPNDQIGGTTMVTYNINATDARSFQELVARDPEFIYAVTLKGQRSMPGGLR